MLTDLGAWLVFIHVLAAFLFAAGHGVSLFVAFGLRRERNPERIGALLDTSRLSLNLVAAGLLGLLISGFAAGWVRGSMGTGWFWTSLVLLIVIGGLMTPLGSMYYTRVRQAIGQRHGLEADAPDPVPASAEELDRLLSSRRPELLLALGGGGFVIILWLMMFRPF
jgi:hypothetical protein